MSEEREKTMLADLTEILMGAAASEIVRLRTELEQARDAIARAWEEGAEAAFDAQAPSEDSDYLNPLYGRALDEFYASNPYRRHEPREDAAEEVSDE